MKKYLFVISGMKANGAERVMSILVNWAARTQREVSLVLLQCPDIEYEIDSRVKVYTNSIKSKSRVITMVSKVRWLRKIIRVIGPDVIISFLTTCNIYSCFASVGFRIPLIVSERNSPNIDCDRSLRRCIRDISYHIPNGFVFQTEDAKKCFSRQIQSKSVVIPNPVKDGLPFAKISEAHNRVVALGRLSKQKNYVLLLNSFKLFHMSHPDYILDIYGEGEDKEFLLDYVKAIQIENYVHFWGNVKKVHELIVDARMYVLSSDYEGISNSLLEAMAMGLPSISTDCPCGGSRMLIQDGENGLLVPVGDVLALESAMSRIANSLELASELSTSAKTVRDTYSENSIVLKYYEFIDSFLYD